MKICDLYPRVCSSTNSYVRETCCYCSSYSTKTPRVNSLSHFSLLLSVPSVRQPTSAFESSLRHWRVHPAKCIPSTSASHQQMHPANKCTRQQVYPANKCILQKFNPLNCNPINWSSAKILPGEKYPLYGTNQNAPLSGKYKVALLP